MSRAECKNLARNIMKNNWIMAFVIVLIYSVISAALSTITSGIGILLLSSSLFIALYNCFINAYYGKGYEVSHMLQGWDKGISNRLILSLLKTLYIFLWSLLFFIPGIIKTYSYTLAEFISREHPEKTATECLNESRKLMNGHKMELFLLDFSFFGWMLLSVLTCGILYIWVLPYMYQTRIIFIDKNIYHLVDLSNNGEYIETEIKENPRTYQARYCSNCGRQVSDSDSYCPSCGNKLS